MTEPAVAAAQLETIEDFTEQLSTTFDTCYTWSYDTFKAGLFALLESFLYRTFQANRFVHDPFVDLSLLC